MVSVEKAYNIQIRNEVIMEYNKLYQMKLYIIDDYQLAIKSDTERKYYVSKNGQFYPNPNMKEMG